MGRRASERRTGLLLLFFISAYWMPSGPFRKLENTPVIMSKPEKMPYGARDSVLSFVESFFSDVGLLPAACCAT
jgi:hypothetical protein